MGHHNSLGPDRFSYLDLFLTSYSEVASASALTKVEVERDVATVRRRFSAEGMSFFTKTLPRLGKAVDMALSQGAGLQCSGFSRIPGTQLPKFLGWLVRQVFNDDGTERCETSEPYTLSKRIVALGQLRQLCYLFYKLELPYTEDQEQTVIKQFVTTDRYTSDGLYQSCEVWNDAVYLIHQVLGDEPDLGALAPRHGPGAVATGEKPHEKIYFRRYYRALDEVFSYERYFFYNANHFSDSLSQFHSWETLEAGTAKVVLVPKDSRGPRLISCEPLEYQWIQQGLMDLLNKKVQEHPLTRGRIGFRDQSVNRRLALIGSVDGSWVTLDMKEASDRVMLRHVEASFPHMWFKALRASRTTATLLPDGTVFPLRKFAPMGSAVCFPVEALLFWALTAAAIKNANTGYCSLEQAARSVYVFGDDLIVRHKDHVPVLRTLPRYGLQFNAGKCCIAGNFRESCGCDAYHGVDVTPLKIKSVWDRHLTNTSHASWVEYHNSLIRRGYFATADYLADCIQQARPTPYANKEGSECPALVDPRKNAAHENKFMGMRTRFNTRLHYYEVWSWVAVPVRYRTGTSGWEEMLRVASYRRENDDSSSAPPADLDLIDPDRLMVSPGWYHARRRVTQKRRWARVIL